MLIFLVVTATSSDSILRGICMRKLRGVYCRGMSKLHAGICYEPLCFRLLALNIKSPNNYKSLTYHLTKAQVKKMVSQVNARLQDLVIQKRNQPVGIVEKIDKDIAETLKRKKQLLSSIEHSGQSSEILDIEKAKQYPVTSVLEFDQQGNTNCIWHNEKTPSLHYFEKTNSVYCFGCKKYGSVVDVIMTQQERDFISAVKYLLNL